MADRKQFNYYDVLGVPKSATADDIKNAYRIRAKELHPDKNHAADATARFQQLQEAYSVLGSPERRQLFDQGNFEAAVDPATKATEAVFDPVPCDGCGCISAQPRFVQYDRVISAIIISYKIRPAGVFCPKCASKRLFLNTFITASVGWIGFRGFFWSLEAFFNNLTGGKKSPGLNAFLLARQAAYFMQQGNSNLANALAVESLDYFKAASFRYSDYSLGKSGAEVSQIILSRSTGGQIKLKSRWSGWSHPARFALAGFAVPAIFWMVVFKSSADSKEARQSYSGGSNPTNSYSAPASPQYYDVPGNDGHTYRVTAYEYQRLKSIDGQLEARQPDLKARMDDLKSRRALMESQRASLDSNNSYAVATFNQTVDAWNRDKNQLDADFAAFNQEIDANNAELRRVGQLIR